MQNNYTPTPFYKPKTNVANSDLFIVRLLNSLPYTAVILNRNREILYANQVFIDTNIGLSFEDFIGKRPGEAFNCLHFNNSYEACGDTPKCKFCGTANVIMQSQLTKQKQTQESRIIREIDGTEYSFEFEVTASPFSWDDTEYILLTLLDISDQKRKRALERIFFHDILNKTGSLSGFFELIKEEQDEESTRELLDIAESIARDLTEEIVAQKQIMDAETGELITESVPTNSKRIIHLIVRQLSNFEIFKKKTIEIDTDSEDCDFNTDQILLKRILINMLKNALEATGDHEKVIIGCFKNKSSLRFYVQNKNYIPENIQMQIFQRSFSTKSSDRGLGTYSMKLLGERYLNGKVHFTSNEEDGTTFYFDLPLGK
ncbi:MAG: ATP-binding protein [Bacteroidales bacterium]